MRVSPAVEVLDADYTQICGDLPQEKAFPSRDE